MPGLIMERPKMSLQMHENLKKYILRERKKKKEEDVANEQKIQKMKEEMKRAEMNTQTLEQTKEQVKQLEIKLEELQHKKRELFGQLKKVLNEETSMKKRPLNMPEPPISLFQPLPYHQVFPSSPMRFISAPARPPLFKPETIMSPQALKRTRSPSPPPPQPPPQTVMQSAASQQAALYQQQQQQQHQSLLAASTAAANQNAAALAASLSSVTNNPVNFQSHMFSPNKKTRVGGPPAPQNAPLPPPQMSYPSVLVGQGPQQQRLQSPYNPQQSAFSTYSSHFINALQQQQQQQQQQQPQQQQKATMLGVPNSQIHGPGIPYGMPPRLGQGGGGHQLDANTQKMLFQSPQLLISHPQSGGITMGYPIQRPPQQQQPPYQ